MQAQSQFSKDGGGQPGQMDVAATPKCKEGAYWKHKEREKFIGFDHEIFYHHAFYVGYNVTNIIYNIIKAGKGFGGLPQEKLLQMHFLQRRKIPLCKFPERYTGT